MQRWYSLLVPRSAKSLSWFSISIVFAISFLALLGWALDIPLLKSAERRWIPMKVTTAICFILLAAALGFLQRNLTGLHRHIAVQAAGVLVPCNTYNF
jgi:hypothetical protein